MIPILAGFLWDVCGIIFVLSGVSKAVATRSFRRQLGTISFIPRRATRPLALLIPLMELGIGTLILLRIRLLEALICSLCMMAVFTAFVIWALKTKKSLTCFCFGEKETKITGLTLLRNLIIVAVIIAAVFLDPKHEAGSPGFSAARALSLGYGASTVLILLTLLQVASLRDEIRQLG